MTLSELREAVYRQLGDDDGSRWGASEVDTYLNEALREVIHATGALHSVAALSPDPTPGLSPGPAFYRMPSDFAMLESLDVGGEDMRPLALGDMRSVTGWATESGSPEYFLLGPWGMRTLRLYPAPAAAVVPLLYYERMPQPITETNNGELLDAYTDALIPYAAAKCLMRDSDDAEVARASAYMGDFARRLEGLVSAAQSGFTTQTPRVPYRHI